MKKLSLFALAVLTVVFMGCGGGTSQSAGNDSGSKAASKKEESGVIKGQAYVQDGVSEKNALQVAASLDDFSTLAKAVMAAGVENALANNGPLTVFAPTNAAFEKLPAGTVETLLKPENKQKLAFILVNHVAPSNYPIETLEKNIKKGRKLFMASGEYLPVEKKDGKIYVGGTPILKSVKVSNGWIHVIGDVLVPKSK